MIKFNFLLFTIFFIFLFTKIAFTKDNSPRISIGAGQFNFMEDGTPPYNKTSEMLNFEIHSGRKLFNVIKPLLGFLGTSAGTYYAYGGFGIDGYYGKKKNILLTPSVACGYYKDGSEIKAGNHMEFYIGIDLFYRLRNNVRVGAGIFHISNADSGYRNPGSETLLFKYQIPF